MEEWINLDEYDGYAISDQGRIQNLLTGWIKRPSVNQQGILMVNFSIQARQHVRSVAVLTANQFLDRSGIPAHFDTPIHLNGDKTDCRVENLAWRPRWFARAYHHQFDPIERAVHGGFKKPVLLIDTDEVFPTSWEAAIKYGLLDREIFLATINATIVFPHNFRFEEYFE